MGKRQGKQSIANPVVRPHPTQIRFRLCVRDSPKPPAERRPAQEVRKETLTKQENRRKPPESTGEENRIHRLFRVYVACKNHNLLCVDAVIRAQFARHMHNGPVL